MERHWELFAKVYDIFYYLKDTSYSNMGDTGQQIALGKWERRDVGKGGRGMGIRRTWKGAE